MKNQNLEHCRLRNFPISFFSIVMGLVGLVIAGQKIQKLMNIDFDFSFYFLIFSSILFLIIFLIYLLKFLFFSKDVSEEFRNPVKMNFFPSFSISLLLLSIAFLEINKTLARILWIEGTLIQTFFTFIILSIWIKHDKFKIHHMNPSWFIPIVGNLLIPIAGVQFFDAGFLWIFFSIGILFWIVLFTIFINRAIFHHPLDEKLLPTFFILIAPPAVGFISYIKLNSGLDNFSRILYFFALFLFFFLFVNYKMFSKIKFYLSWWAYSFPIAAMTISSFLMFKLTKQTFFKIITLVIFGVLSLIVLILIMATFKAIKNHNICVRED